MRQRVDKSFLEVEAASEPLQETTQTPLPEAGERRVNRYDGRGLCCGRLPARTYELRDLSLCHPDRAVQPILHVGRQLVLEVGLIEPDDAQLTAVEDALEADDTPSAAWTPDFELRPTFPGTARTINDQTCD